MWQTLAGCTNRQSIRDRVRKKRERERGERAIDRLRKREKTANRLATVGE